MIDQIEHITIWGRVIKPIAFGIMLSMITVFVFYVPVEVEGGHSEIAEAIGYGALGVALLLFIGWLRGSKSLTVWGLLLASGAWITRWVFLLFTGKYVTIGFYLTFCWVVVCAGAYLVERWYVSPHEREQASP